MIALLNDLTLGDLVIAGVCLGAVWCVVSQLGFMKRTTSIRRDWRYRSWWR